MHIRLLLLLFLLLRLAAADQFDSVRGFIRKELVTTNMPSIAVAVARDGKIIWEEGFGWADREKHIAATAQTMYSLASISKPITATGLMVLVQAGKIDLDRPINDYLGAAKLRARVGDAAHASVRRVASHSSGLPLHYQFFYADEPYRPPPMDETIRRYANLVTIPGEKYEYSNLGFGILDYIIARVSGRPYEEYMRQEVFSKLRLTHTSVGPLQNAVAATRYGADGEPIPFYDFDHRGASAIYASAHDLVRFGLFHLKAHLADQAAILSDASIDEMHKPTVSSGPRAGYGVGWAVTDTTTGYHVVSHTGGMGGVATSLRIVPSAKLAVVVLCNGNHALPHAVAEEIFGVLLPKWEVQRKVPPLPPEPSPFQAPAELLGKWTGKLCTYKAELPFTLRIQTDGVQAHLGTEPETAVSNLRWVNGYLSGRMQGDIGTEDANRRPYLLQLTLKLRGDALNGPASAISRPGARAGNALTQWVEVRRESLPSKQAP
jgi:CubicO group peptidase (beta-lactamase class C family)